MPATADLMLTSRTDVQLGRLYNAMHATARELGIEWPRRSEFSRPALIRECGALNDKIESFRAGLDADDDKEIQAGSPGLRRLRSHPRAGEIRQQTLTDNVTARREAERRIQRGKKMSEDTATAAVSAEPKAKKAKKAAAPKKTAKTAKKAKKAKTKKTAKKAAKTAKKSAGGARSKFNPDHVITWTGEDNPRRKGSAAYDRLEKVRKSTGKKVAAFKTGGGREATLNYAVKHKLARVA